jgi:hypothetical protein
VIWGLGGGVSKVWYAGQSALIQLGTNVRCHAIGDIDVVCVYHFVSTQGPSNGGVDRSLKIYSLFWSFVGRIFESTYGFDCTLASFGWRSVRFGGAI